MRGKKIFSAFIIFSIIIQLLCISPVSAGEEATEYVTIGTTNDAGDYCYFNNHYCYTSIDPNYNNLSITRKTNYVECYRLDYTNPKRKDYIYLEKTDENNDCYFDVKCTRLSYTKYQKKTYRNFLIQGDFKVTVAGADVQMFLFRDKTSSGTNLDYVSARLSGDGSLKLSDGTVIPDVAKNNTWFNLKAAINLDTSLCEVYVDGEKKGTLPMTGGLNYIDMVRLNMLTGTGNIYVDNFSVTGLEVPYENGVEVITDVFPDNPSLKEFMQDKIGMHGYGRLMYKDGIKTAIDPEPVFDKERLELYVHTDTLNEAFDLTLTEGTDTISGSGITITADGAVSFNGKTTTLKGGLLTVTDKMYVPVTEFAEAIGKYAFSYDNGVVLISDENRTLDTEGWQYVTFRPDQSAITLFEDMDFLNNLLSYEQPDSEKLAADFKATAGDYESAHPRILLNQSDFDRLKELYKTDNTYKIIVRAVLSKANEYYNKEPLVYVFDDAMRMYRSGAETQNRFMYWGFAYKITGDMRYVRRAVKELEALDKFPDFNPMHIIDTGMFCMGLACAYDWFYEAYTPKELELAKRVVFEKCFKSLSDAYSGRLSQATSGNGTVKWTSNYNAVVSGGCLNAAIATMECDPEYNLRIIDNCIRSLEYTLAGIMPGGGWSESVSYWNYTMEFLSYAMASLNTSFGSDYGISKSQGMEETLKYAMACIGTGGLYNFHDCGSNTASLTNSYKCFMYLAKLYGIEDAYGMRMYEITNKKISPVIEDAMFYGGEIENEDEIYDKDGTAIRIDGTELFSVRDTYNRDKSKFYFATHFGATWGYHHHCDCGSFVLDINGTRFADDLGSDDYNLENELKYHSAQLYRKRGEGHNIMIFDRMAHTGSFEQLQYEFAPITGSGADEKYAYVIADMDNVYAESTNVSQGYYIDKEKMSVTMRNEFTVTPGTEVYWFMHTRADIQIDGNKAYLTRNGQTVCVRFDTNAPIAEIMEMDAGPMPESPQVPEQNPNDAYSKVAIRLNATQSNYLTVNICPLEHSGDEIMVSPLIGWSLDMNNPETIQEILLRDSSDDFSYSQGSEAKGFCGAAAEDSALYVPVGSNTVQLSSDTFTANNRYTVASFNIAPVRATPLLCDKSGNNLLEAIGAEPEKWNHISVIYDSLEGKSITAVNGSYGKWKDTDYTGGSAVFSLKGSDDNAYACVDNFRLYTTSVIPEYDYTVIYAPEIDGSYILSDGSLTAGDITSNGTLRVYTDSSMSELADKDTVLGEGAVAVAESNKIFHYMKVTLLPTVELPNKIYQMVDEFNSSVCVRNTVEAMPDITGGYGNCAYIRGSEDSDTNHYFNFVMNVDDLTKTISVDIYPTDTVSKIKFATNGHSSLSRDIITDTLVPGQWNNLKLIINPLTDENTLYINGVEDSTMKQKMTGHLRLVFYTEEDRLCNSEIYMDNLVVYTEDFPDNIFETSFTIEGNVIKGATGKTVEEFSGAFTTSSYKYFYGIYNDEGKLLNSDIIKSGDVLYLYGSDLLLGKYIIE